MLTQKSFIRNMNVSTLGGDGFHRARFDDIPGLVIDDWVQR